VTERDRGETTGPREEMSGQEWHPTEVELIGALESDEDSEPLRRARDHVIRCSRCHALQAEALRSLSEWKWSRGGSEVPVEWVDAARAAPAMEAAPVPEGGRPAPTSPAHATRRRGRSLGWLIASAVAVVVIGLAFVARSPRDPAWIEPVSTAVAKASHVNEMVLTPNIAPAASMRGAQRTADLDVTMERLNHEVDTHRRSEEAAYWLAAGMLATDDADAGRRLDDVVRRFTGSARIANLEAVYLYRTNHVADADEALKRILERWPNDRVALFNRALLLKNEKRIAELSMIAPALRTAFAGHDALSERFRREAAISAR